MVRRPPRSTLERSSAASDVYRRQLLGGREDVDDPAPHGELPAPLDHVRARIGGGGKCLDDLVERALVTAKGRVLTEDDFAFLRPVSEAAPGWSVPTHLPLADVEKTVIAATLKRNEGNVKETALVLGIDRSTLYDKLKRYGIERT